MFGGTTALLLAALIAIWFYRTARAMNDDKPWTWLFIGAICFYGFFALWRMLVVRPVVLLLGLHHNTITTMLIASSAIVLAALFAAIIRRRYLVKGRLE